LQPADDVKRHGQGRIPVSGNISAGQYAPLAPATVFMVN